MAAAIEAGARGAAVLLLEAADELGGSTRMSAGVFYATETSVQRSAGVSDSVEAMFAYYMALNHLRAAGRGRRGFLTLRTRRR